MKTGEGMRPEQGWQWPTGFWRWPSVRWVRNDGYGNTATWATRLRHLREEWLTERPCPQRCSRGGGAHRRPAGEVVEEGGRPVEEVASVCAVLREVPVGPGDDRSDSLMWMASAVVGVDGGR
jgi:hypothetical protein